MANTSKKASGAKTSHASGKHTTSQAATKAAHATLAVVESSRHSAENMLRMGSDVVRDFLNTGAAKGGSIQEKLSSFGREAAEKLSRSSETVSKKLSETADIGRENMETMVEISGVAATVSKEMGSELYNYFNELFAQNVELSKEAFACRTITDLFELQSNALKTNLDSFFNQSMRMSEMFFQYASEAAEPINERVAEATERFSKVLAA